MRHLSRGYDSTVYLLPRHQRRVNHILDALAADRANSEVHILQAEFVGRHQLQRKTFGGELRQGKLARLEAVAACALDGDELHRHPADRKVREIRHFALNHDGPGLALERLDAEQHRNRAGAGGAVEHDVDALAASDLHDAGEWIFSLDIDDMVSAELPGDLWTS